MKIAIGLGLDKNPEKAARTALAQALKTVPKPGLAVAFSSIHLDQVKVHRELCRHLDPAILTGGSCYAEITNAGVSRGSVALLLLDGPGLKADFSVADISDDCRKTGLDLAAGIKGGAKDLSLVFGSIATGKEQLMLDAIAEKLAPAPVFGGLTCGDYDLGMSHPDFWTNYQYCARDLKKRGARLASLKLPEGSRLAFGYGHGWEPVGEELTITRAEGPAALELNGVPVIEFYRQFLGRDAKEKFFELMVQRYGFSIAAPGAGKTIIKLPVSCDFKKGSITYFPSEDLQGKKVRLIQASRTSLIEGARQAALECAAVRPGKKPALVFMVSCCSRSHILHSRVNDELEAVRGVFGREVPVFGMYSGGEIVPWSGTCRAKGACGSFYHVTTVALMAVYAPGKVKASVPKVKLTEASDPAAARLLLARSEEMLDTTESFLANMSRKSYKDGALLRRQHEMIHAYTPHGVWKEVGAVAAAGGKELLDADFNGVFMFMDVKGFTPYSEAHTSAEVVQALNEIFAPATGLIYSHGGDVDKYIGDCIFACFPSAGAACRAARDILLLFARLRDRGNPFNVRIGLNGGRAVRANVGSADRREYTFIGDAVNTAQRLESNCEPGKVLVSAAVYAEAASVFSSAVEKVVPLKGKAKPMAAFLCEP
ncbi:MAG: adenylate/guanylate cyclase domain-containing protein [Elusimicrobiales bacterium]|nr:adenylate/guanylate cyclase domain-containing protein [Elusimicrobiales bacterium]